MHELTIQQILELGPIDTTLHQNSPHRDQIRALQHLLHGLGFSRELNWERYGPDGFYGAATCAAVKAFCRQNGLAGTGEKVTQEIGQTLIRRWDEMNDSLPPGGAARTPRPAGAPPGPPGPPGLFELPDLSPHETEENGRKRLYLSGPFGQVRFTFHKQGVFYTGTQKPLTFIQDNRPKLIDLGLTDSAVNTITAVSENEGRLDAVNTWDNAFLSFGMFQWTLGAGGSKGELPALMEKIRQKDPDVFDTYFGRYGLSPADADKISGYLTLNGQELNTAEGKAELRRHEWAYLFWSAGQDPLVQSVQIAHALSRINGFYRTEHYRVGPFFISDLVTSEFGVALVLGNHVNRPGYVAGCLETALKESGLQNPNAWGTPEEQQFLDRYLEIRQSYGKYPMTDARVRGENIRPYVSQGVISDRRGSFLWPGG